MRIGILTLRLHKNYGGILQNYALNKALTNAGHQVETINIIWDIRIHGWKKYYIWTKRIIKNCIKMKWHPIDIENKILKEDPLTTQNTTLFKQKFIPLTQKKYFMPYADFTDINEKYDAIIVGSDQVWRPKYTLGINRYFLDFITNNKIKKIAYAASFGTDENEYTPLQQKVCGKLIKSFDAISVREEGAIKLIQEKLRWKVKATRTIDPTMLLDVENYKNLIGNYTENNKIFVYILDNTNDKQKAIHIVEKEIGLSSFTLTPEGMANESTSIIPPIEEWLKAIASSKFIITDSFHGCVFSILFNKPFIIYGNSFRGKSRFDSLLKIFNLEEHYISTSDELIQRNIINKKIDWEMINQTISQEKKQSLEFLYSALS